MTDFATTLGAAGARHARGLQRQLPWLLTAGLLCVVALRIDLLAVRDALHAAAWGRYLAVAGVFTGIWFVLDAFILSRLVSRFHCAVSMREMFPLRGASYLAMVLSYDAGQLALAVALHRRYGIAIFAIGGTFLFYYLVDLVTIGSLGSIGAAFVSVETRETIQLALGLLLFGATAALIVLRAYSRAPLERVPARLRGARVLATLQSTQPADFARFVAYRVCFYASFVAFAALSMPAFGIHVPALSLVAFVPIVMSVSALPVTVAGVGSTQVIMWALYGAYAPASAVLAYSVAYSATLLLLRLPIGVICLRIASKEMHPRGDLHAA